MEKSLKRLKNQDDDIIIYPGHGPSSNLKIEKMMLAKNTIVNYVV